MAAGFNINALKAVASNADPTSISPTTLLRYTSSTATIFDKYPKAQYHFLILPRIDPKVPSRTTGALHDLKSLLRLGKAEASKVLKDLEVESLVVEGMIKDEMQRTYGEGVEWQVMKGFHAVQSMNHLHLHVISSDYVSPSLKNKKHWNSFNPTHGFFLHLHDVIEWLNLPDAAFKEHIHSVSQSEPLLKDTMSCWKCSTSLSNLPKLKDHLQIHFDKDLAALRKKRKHEADADENDGNVLPEKFRRQE